MTHGPKRISMCVENIIFPIITNKAFKENYGKEAKRCRQSYLSQIHMLMQLVRTKVFHVK